MKRMLIYPFILGFLFLKGSNHAFAAMPEQPFSGSAVQSGQSKNPLMFGLNKDQHILVEYILFSEKEEDDNDDSPAKKKSIFSRFSSKIKDAYDQGDLSNPIKNNPQFYKQFYSPSYHRYIFQRVLRV